MAVAAFEGRQEASAFGLSVALTGNALVGRSKIRVLIFGEGKGKKAGGERPLRIVGGGV